MLHTTNLSWSKILGFHSAQYQLTDIKLNKEIQVLPEEVQDFAERFSEYIRSCRSPIYNYGSRITQTYMETRPLVLIGMFSYDSAKEESTFSIAYDYGKEQKQ